MNNRQKQKGQYRIAFQYRNPHSPIWLMIILILQQDAYEVTRQPEQEGVSEMGVSSNCNLCNHIFEFCTCQSSPPPDVVDAARMLVAQARKNPARSNPSRGCFVTWRLSAPLRVLRGASASRSSPASRREVVSLSPYQQHPRRPESRVA